MADAGIHREKSSRSDSQTDAGRMIALGGKPGEGVERMGES